MTEPILTIDQALPAPAERDEDLGTQYAESQSLTRAEMAQKTIDEFMAEQASGKPAGRVTSESGVPPASAGIGETVKSGAKAVASAIPQIPTQVAGGVVDAFKETVQAIEDVSEFALHGVMGGDEVERIMERSRKLSPLQVAAGALPDIKQPRGTGGAVVREGAKFMAAFVPLVGQFSKARAALKLTGTATRITADMAAGAIADFLVTDPAEGLLESLVESNPEIQGPVDEFFTNAEDDPAIVNRLKNSLVGAGFGLVADGMIVGMRALRSARRAKVALKAEKKKAAEKQARALGGEPELPTGAASLGDVAAPRAARRSSTKEKMAAAEKRIEEKFPPGTLSREEITRRAALEETSIEVNLERIDGPEDVKALYQEVTDLFSDSISEARRGVRSNELTQEAADRLGLSVDDVLRRRKGKPLNAVESVAFRKIWDDAARQVTELASAANGPTAGPTDLFKFRQALVKFQAITEEVLGARAETARALQSWNIKTGGATEQGRALNQLIEASGGAGTTEALAKRISIASAGGATPGQLSVMMRKGAVARTIEAVQESFVLGLLWTPSTHMVNLASNSIVAAQQILERGVASRIAANRGAVDSVVPGEALAMMHGLVSGMRDMFGVAAQESLARTTIRDASKIDVRMGAISSEAFNLAEESGLGRTVDFFGAATRFPGRLLQAEDQLFKTIGFSMELNAHALREATRLGGTKKEIAENMARIMNDPPESIRLAAADAALYNTFQDQAGSIGKWLMAGRRTIPPLTVLIPFVRTPTRILGYTFERTPFAPLVGQWRADIAAGGARADIAKARMAVGTTMMAVISDYAYSGFITGNGPKNDAEREALIRQGWARESIRIGDTNYTYNRTDPFGFQASVAANVAEAFRDHDIDEEDAAGAAEIFAAAILATSATVTDKTYFFGVSQMLDALRDPSRYGQAVLNRTITSFVVFNTALRTAVRLSNPERSDPNTVYESIQAMVPVWEKGLTRRMDLWGDPFTSENAYGPAFSRALDVASPVKAFRQKDSPIDAEMTAQGIGVARIRKKTVIDGVAVNFRQFPRVYEAYVKLAGNDAKELATGQGARDFLNAVVTGDSIFSEEYGIRSDGPDGSKATFIKSTISQYRQLAQRELMDPDGEFQGENFDRFRKLIRDKREARQQAELEALQ